MYYIFLTCKRLIKIEVEKFDFITEVFYIVSDY